MLTISDKAKAILALDEEMQNLLKEAQRISDKQFSLHTKFINDLEEYSLQQRIILDKITMLEVAKDRIFKGD